MESSLCGLGAFCVSLPFFSAPLVYSVASYEIPAPTLDLKGSLLWSKAGWTSQTRHHAAYVELPHGVKSVLVTFTLDHANEREIIPSVEVIVEGIRRK